MDDRSPDPTQRSRWSPSCQRFTFRKTRSTIANADSMTLVQASVFAIQTEPAGDARSTFPPSLLPNSVLHSDSGPSVRDVTESMPPWRSVILQRVSGVQLLGDRGPLFIRE